tara:strand:- start:521 stop:661 length:141 start_codon:yes stop_codon:yes gene_type:complete
LHFTRTKPLYGLRLKHGHKWGFHDLSIFTTHLQKGAGGMKNNPKWL